MPTTFQEFLLRLQSLDFGPDGNLLIFRSPKLFFKLLTLFIEFVEIRISDIPSIATSVSFASAATTLLGTYQNPTLFTRLLATIAGVDYRALRFDLSR